MECPSAGTAVLVQRREERGGVVVIHSHSQSFDVDSVPQTGQC